MVPFGRLFGTLGGHIRPRSVALFSSHIAVVRYLIQNSFSSRIFFHSEYRLECFGSYIALVRHGSGSVGLSSLWCILQVYLMSVVS
jgi:hypothetical protein